MAFIRALISFITAVLFSLSLMPGPRIINGDDPEEPAAPEPVIKYSAAVTETVPCAQPLSLVSKSSFGSNRHDRVTGADSRGGICYVCGSAGYAQGDFSSAGSGKAPFGFIRRYDSSGNLTASAYIKDSSRSVYLSDICVLRNGNAVVCGYTYFSNNTNGADKGFVAEYSTNLTQLWRYDFVCSDSVNANSVSATSNGFVVGGMTSGVDGDFAGTDFFGHSGAFLMRFRLEEDSSTGTHTGTVMWKKTVFGDGTSQVAQVAADSSNNIFVTLSVNALRGNYSGFEGLVPGSLDNVLLRYSGNGVLEWSIVLASLGRDYFECVAPDATGGCVAGGYVFRDGANVSTDLGGTLAGLKHTGGVDSFVFIISSSGSITHHRSISGSGDDYIFGITKSGSEYVLAGSSTSSNSEFTSNYGEHDGFAQVISSTGAKSEMLCLGGTENDRVYAITASAGTLFACGSAVSKDNYFAGMNQYATTDYSSGSAMDSADCFIAVYS